MPLQQGTVQSPAPSRFAFGCVVAFGLLFAGAGLLALVQSARHYATRPDAIVGIVVGGVFTLTGLGIVIGAAYGASNLKRKAALRTAHPDQPWKWREDWANGAIRDTNRQNTIGLWVFAIIWNAISFPIAFFAGPQVASDNKWVVLIVLLFPFVGVIMLISAIYQTMRSMKFGTSVCHLERVPIVPGRLFRGDVQLQSDATPANGYRLHIMSINAVTTRTGKNRSTSERLVWDAETVVESSAAMRSPMGTRVPFQFATPPDAHPSDDRDDYDRYPWRLAATAELPGVDYSAQFELPVFLSGEKADGSEFAAFEQRHRAEAARQPIAPAAGVEITRLPGGGEQFRHMERRDRGDDPLRRAVRVPGVLHRNRSASHRREHRLLLRPDHGQRQRHGRAGPERMARQGLDENLSGGHDHLDRRPERRSEQQNVRHHDEVARRRHMHSRFLSARPRKRRHRRRPG